MFFLHKVDAQRPIGIERRSFPWTHIFFAARRCLFHQRPHRFRYTGKFACFLYVPVDPQLSLSSFNRRHLALLKLVVSAWQSAQKGPYFTVSTIPILSKALKYSTPLASGTGPYSADTASRISCAFRFPSAKFSTSYAYSSPLPHNPAYSSSFGFVVCPRFAHSASK